MTTITMLNGEKLTTKESPEEIKALTSDKGFIILSVKQEVFLGIGEGFGYEDKPQHLNVNHISTMRPHGN